MKKINKALALILCAALCIALLGACGRADSENSAASPSAGSGSAESGSTESAVSAAPSTPSASATLRTPADIDLTEAVVITLSGSSVQIDGSGAEESGGVITITGGGIYAVSGTLDDGRIIVNAPGAKVTIALNGASINCSYGSPIYIYKSSSATVHLVAGTKNALSDGKEYTYADSFSSASEEEPNACLYSKSDLTIEGAGTLDVEASFNNGITGKDTLEIYDADLFVFAVNHGINGKDSNTIDSACVTVTCGGDAIRSTNDSDSALGWVDISNSTLTLTSGEDGIQAETHASLTGVSGTVTSGGGSSAAPSEDVSAKGIKAGTALTLSGGVLTLDCSDDALHSNGDVLFSAGACTISTGDDALHADGTLTVSGGSIDILKAYEGLEGSDVDISGGEISIVSSDDGVNAAGGSDGSGFGGRGTDNAFASSGSGHSLTVSGGSLYIIAGGDGLDSNGTITMTGGTVLVNSTGGGDGSLDYDGNFTLEGGVLLAACSGSMVQVPTAPGQYTLSIQFGSILPAGSYIRLAGSSKDLVFCLSAPAGNIIFSSPELEKGDVYSVYCGGDYSGENSRGLCSGGSYTGGTLLTELDISDYLTTYGQFGMGGSRGGNMFGKEGQHGSFGRDGTEPPDKPAPDTSFGGGGGDKRV